MVSHDSCTISCCKRLGFEWVLIHLWVLQLHSIYCQAITMLHTIIHYDLKILQDFNQCPIRNLMHVTSTYMHVDPNMPVT